MEYHSPLVVKENDPAQIQLAQVEEWRKRIMTHEMRLIADLHAQAATQG